MKIFNLSLKEFLKNKLYFSYFAFGSALLLAVVCVLANYSEQVFDGFFTQFDHGQVLPLEMKELPHESQYFGELPIFAECSGITYDITVTHENKSIYLPSYRGGLCVVSEGSFKFKELSLITGDGTKPRFEKGIIYLTQELVEDLGCKKGDIILIDSSEYEVGDVILTSEISYSFFIYDPDIITNVYTVTLSNKDQLLDVTKYLNSRNYSDTEGILALCEGYRTMRTAMDIVLVLLTVVCAAYILVFIKMYFSKRREFLIDLLIMGMKKSRLFMCMAVLFDVLCVIGGTSGFLLGELLDRLVDMWAQEFLGMSVDNVNYHAYFAVGTVVCIVIAAVSLLINIKGLTDSEVRNR